VQKLEIFGNKVFVHDNDRLYCKLRCNVRLATLAQLHRVRNVGRQEDAIFEIYKFRKGMIMGAQMFQFAPKFPETGRLSPPKAAQNEPKLRESCVLWQKLRSCAIMQKLQSAHHNFLGGGYVVYVHVSDAKHVAFQLTYIYINVFM